MVLRLFAFAAIVLFFGCTSLERDNPYDENGDNYIGHKTFTDSRDNKTYKYVQIGNQIWMAENLSYDANGSECYNNKSSNCAKYGRLYNWNAAMSACPSGWHLPSKAEWDALTSYIENDKNCSSCDAKHLKAANWWGQDTYGFAGLPGGYGDSAGYFLSAGGYANWWSATERGASNAYDRSMYYDSEYAYWNYGDKAYIWFSVRCVQD